MTRTHTIQRLSIIACIVCALLPQFSSAQGTTCVNGRLIGENGADVGVCNGTGAANGATNVNFSDTYAFKRQGVFGCSLQGSYSMSVGAMGAVGGAYVPVNDASVTLNTGYLVYKECVLRGVVNRQREAATAGIVQQVTNTALTGRGGNPMYPTYLPDARNTALDATVVRILQDGTLNAIPEPYRASVNRAIARSYRDARLEPTSKFKCAYTGDLRAALEGREFSLRLLGDYMSPGCNPYGAYTAAQQYIGSAAQESANDRMTKFGWAEGFYDVEECDEYGGNCKTLTPGSIVRANLTQALQTGFDQLARANDIDQMVGALFSGIISQVIGDNRGLQGLTQKTGTQPSYIEQVVRESAQGLRDAAGNAALQILASAKQVEVGFRQAMESIKGVLTAAIQDLRAKEAACWNLVIQSVCATPLAADNTCTEKTTCTADPQNPQGPPVCPNGGKLKVATSTAYSQQVIDARILSYASTTENNIAKSNEALILLDRLIAGITNTNSLDAQRVALQQLDNLVAQRQLHNQYDLQGAQKALDDITASMDTLRTDTVKAWADSTDPNIGWCNVNNQTVLDMWRQKWKQ